ncbi:MAG: helix-hairpin-helix domain-containing protein [Anaerolineae bacterium]
MDADRMGDVGGVPEEAVARYIRTEELRRWRAQVREQMRAEAWSNLRTWRRITLAGVVLATLLVGMLIGAYGLQMGRPSVPLELVPPDGWAERVGHVAPTLSVTPWPIRVYVSGAVRTPQVVELPPGSLVGDAIEAAGGVAADADLDALNLAAPLSDNQHVLVPRLAAAGEVGGAASAGAGDAAMYPLDINTASSEALQSLPDIGAVRAEAIIAFREAHGPFRHAEELMEVPGIGPVIYERIAPLIVVESQ